MDTRPQQIIRTLEPSYRGTQQIPKMISITGNTINYRTLQMVPDPFIRIQLRSIARELKGSNDRVVFEPLLDRRSSMRHATIPEQNETFRQMPFEMLQKLNDLRPTDVLLRMKSHVKRNPFALQRYANRRNRGYLRPTPSTRQDGRLPTRCPGSSYRRDQEKATLIEEYQRDATPSSVFLYVAIGNVSSVLWLLRSVLLTFSQVSDSSNPIQLKVAKYDWDDKQFSNAALLLWQLAAWSTDRWSNRSLRPLAKEFVSVHPSAFGLILQASLVPAWTLVLVLLLSQRAASRDELNLQSNRLPSTRPTDSFHFAATRGPVGVALRDAFGFHVVSWNHIIMVNNMFLLLLRKSIV